MCAGQLITDGRARTACSDDRTLGFASNAACLAPLLTAFLTLPHPAMLRT